MSAKRFIVILGVSIIALTITIPCLHAWNPKRNKAAVVGGLRDGSLNPTEFRRVKRYHNETVRMKRKFRADGYLSPKEKSLIGSRHDIESDAIRKFREGPNRSGHPWLK